MQMTFTYETSNGSLAYGIDLKDTISGLSFSN